MKKHEFILALYKAKLSKLNFTRPEAASRRVNIYANLLSRRTFQTLAESYNSTWCNTTGSLCLNCLKRFICIKDVLWLI